MNAAAHPMRQNQILVVDDDEYARRILLAILQDAGYQVSLASNGKEGLEQAQKRQPDLVLLDIRMPDMDGYEVCQRLKANPATHDTPVIFISAIRHLENQQQAFQMGGVDYIIKPLQVQEVLMRTRLHLGLRRNQQQLARFNQDLKRLHRLSTQSFNDAQHFFQAHLQAGCERFACAYGLFQQVQQQQLICHARLIEQHFHIGNETPISLEKNYCQAVLAQQLTVAEADLNSLPHWQTRYFHADLKPQRYLATPVWVQNQLYGVLSFADDQAQAFEFSTQERELIELLAHNLGRYIEHQQQEKALKDSQLQLWQMEKSAVLGQLVANVAHEINTPLSIINNSEQKIQHFLHQHLLELPEFFQKLQQAQLNNDFIQLLELALQQDTPRSARDTRQQRRQWQQQLEQQHITEAALLADWLSDMRLPPAKHSDIAALLNHQNASTWLRMAYHLSDLHRNAQRQHNASNKLRQFVLALKNLTAYEAGKVEEKVEIDLVESLENILKLYHSHFQNGIVLHKEYLDTPKIAVYPIQLNQVWLHLLHYALNAITDKGELFIKVEATQQRIKICISYSGKPLSSQEKTQVFEPFVYNEKQPTFLGLAMVKKIIEQHDGKIDYFNANEYMTFEIFL